MLFRFFLSGQFKINENIYFGKLNTYFILVLIFTSLLVVSVYTPLIHSMYFTTSGDGRGGGPDLSGCRSEGE